MNKLESKTLRLRLVEENNAEFILSLRLDERYNAFLSAVPPDVEVHKQWIKNISTTSKLEMSITSSLNVAMVSLVA